MKRVGSSFVIFMTAIVPGVARSIESTQSQPADTRPRPPVTALARVEGGFIAARGREIEIYDSKGTPRGATVALNSFDKITHLAVTRDGRRALAAGGAAGESGSVCFLEISKEKEIKLSDPIVLFNDLATSVSYSDDEKRVAVVSADSGIKILDAHSSAVLHTLAGHTGSVLSVTISGSRVATGGADRTIRIWNIENGGLERVLTSHSGAVLSLAVEPSGGHLLSTSDDRTLREYDLATGRMIQIIRNHDGPVVHVEVPRGVPGTVFTVAGDGVVRACTLSTGSVKSRNINIPVGSRPYVCLHLGDGRLAIGGTFGVVVVDR